MKSITDSFNRFFKQETSSSILLLVITFIALILANTPFSGIYTDFLRTKLTVSVAGNELSKSLILWINDGLMAVFFFVIGLEIKREILQGELSSLKKASLPVIAAIGGMLFPTLIFAMLNDNPETFQGWAIPMATDIAFTLGILKLLGDRVSYGLKIFVTAFAIIDDFGAIIVIALVYSPFIKWGLIAIAMMLLAILAVLTYYRLYSKYLYFVLGIIIWLLFLKSGVHATIAGVLIAFTIPINRQLNFQRSMTDIKEGVNSICEKEVGKKKRLLTGDELELIGQMEYKIEKMQSPLQRLEDKLHGWVAFVVMPIFAFANAGVPINGSSFTYLSIIIAISLVLGNFIGITSFSFLATKLKLAELPQGVKFHNIAAISILGGLGFTMSLFITNLAFVNQDFIDSSKVGILLGSVMAGIIGFTVLKYSLKHNN